MLTEPTINVSPTETVDTVVTLDQVPRWNDVEHHWSGLLSLIVKTLVFRVIISRTLLHQLLL